MFLCSFSEINKNGRNDWKITKLLANTFELSDKLQSKFQCLNFICSWVIRLCFLYICYNLMLFQKLIKTEQTIEKSLNFRQILLNILTSCSQNFNDAGSFSLELLSFVFIYNQLTNYIIITYFFVIFWLQTNVTKKWPFYNVISVRNSNVPKYNLILTSLKNVTTSNKQIT